MVGCVVNDMICSCCFSVDDVFYVGIVSFYLSVKVVLCLNLLHPVCIQSKYDVIRIPNSLKSKLAQTAMV